MSKIMRQLEAEARASRTAATPMPAPAPAPIPEPLVPEPEALCPHGIRMVNTCFACGRWGEQLEMDFAV